MYFRLAGLVTLFNRNLILTLGLPFLTLGAIGVAGSWIWSRIPDAEEGKIAGEFEPKNPLESRAAFLFAVLFLAVLVATCLVVTYFGKAGVYSLAALMGVTVAAAAILIAAASNKLVKGIYAYTMSDRQTALQTPSLLTCLAVCGLGP